MAGDDDIIIKLSADANAALRVFAQIITSFGKIEDAVKAVEKVAESAGLSTAEFLTSFRAQLEKSTFASTSLGKELSATLDQVEAKLGLTVTAAEGTATALEGIGEAGKAAADKVVEGAEAASGATEQQKLNLQAILELTESYREQAEIAAEKMAALTDDEKKAIVELAKVMDDAGQSLQVMAKETGLTVDQIKELIEEQERLGQATKSAIDPIEELAKVTAAFREQQAADAKRVAEMSEQERVAVAAATAELLEQGMSLQKIADAANLSVGSLTLIVDEQEKLAQAARDAEEASKPFWDSWLNGVKASEVATITWGVVMADAFKKLQEGVSEAITSLPSMVIQMANVGDELQTMANRLDTTAASIAELRYFSDQSGASMEGMARTIQTFGASAQTSSSKTAKALASVGISYKELQTLSDQDQFFEVITRLQELPDGIDKNAKAIEIFGSKFRSQTMLLKEDVADLRKSFMELGGAEGINELAAQGDRFSDALSNIQVAMDRFKRGITLSMIGPINTLLEQMPQLGGALLSLGSFLGSTVQAMVPLVSNLILLTAREEGLKGLMKMATGTGSALKNFSTGLFESAKGMASMAKESGGAMATFSKMGEMLTAGATGLLNFGKSVLGIIPTIIRMTGAIIANTAVLLLNPYVAAAVALTALGYAIYKVIAAGRPFAEVLEDLGEALEPLTTFLKDLFTIVYKLGEKGFGYLGKWIQVVHDYLASFWKKTEEGQTWLAKLASGISTFIGWLQKIPFYGVVLTEVIQFFKNLTAAAVATWGKLKEFFTWLGVAAHEYANELTSEEQQAWWDKQQEEVGKTAELTVDASKAMLEANKALDEQVKKLDKGLQAELKTLLKNNSAKEIAANYAARMGLTVEDATAVIERFNNQLKDTAKEAKKSPFAKLMEDAKKMAEELGEAYESQLSFTDIVEQFGKKAADIANRAALRGELDKITAKTVEVGRAFLKLELSEKLKDGEKAALALARAFSEKVVTAVKATAAAAKAMADEITESTLYGAELREFQIKKEHDARLTAIETEKAAFERSIQDRINKEEEAAAVKIAAHTKALLAGESVDKAEHERILLQTAAVIAGVDAEAAAVIEGYAKQTAAAQALFLRRMELSGQYTKFEQQQAKEAFLENTNLIEKDLKQRGAITLKAREKQYKAEADLLAEMLKAQKEGTAEFYQWQIDEQQQTVDRMASEDEKAAAARGMTTRKEYSDKAAAMTKHLAWMLAQGKLFTKAEVEEYKKRVREAKKAAGETAEAWIAGMAKWGAALSSIGSDFAALGKAMDSEKVQKYGAAVEFAGEMLTGAAGIAADMATGNWLGAIMKGVSMVTKAIGKMWDMFSDSKGEKAAKSIGKNFKDAMGESLEVSEEFGDKIAKTAKEMFGGSDFQAQLYHMNDIIEEAGGLSEKNFSNMTARLRDVFTQVGKGTFTVETATKILDENFTAFAEHTLESGKIASKGFQEIIALNAQFGAQSKEIADFVSGQVTVLGNAFEKLMAPHAKAATKIHDELKDQSKELEDVAKDRDKLIKELAADPSKVSEDDKRKLAELTLEWKKQTQVVDDLKTKQGAMAKEAMPDIQRAGRLMMASFNGATASGMSMLDAVDQLGPGLDELLKTTDGLGISVEDAGLSWIVDYRNRVNANRELVDSAGSLNEIMKAMSNIGALNEDSFADLQAQGLSTYDKLEAAGFDDNERLKMMSGYLEQVRNAHEEMGFPIDENTQKMIDQAEANGILKEQEISTNDVLKEGLGEIIKMLGGDLPEAWKKMAKGGVDAAEEVSKGINGGIKKSVEDTTKTLDKVPWQGFASKAVTASGIAARGMGGTTGAIRGVQDELADTDWDKWAQEAEDAASRAEEAVDGVSEGHSPGGIKEIPIKLKQAIGSFRDWSRIAVASAEAVEGAVNASANAQGPGMVGGAGGAGAAGPGGGGDIINEGGDVNIHLHVNDASQAELYVERTLIPQMTKVLGRGRGLRDMKNVLGVN